jgi:hypothetical protein
MDANKGPRMDTNENREWTRKEEILTADEGRCTQIIG